MQSPYEDMTGQEILCRTMEHINKVIFEGSSYIGNIFELSECQIASLSSRIKNSHFYGTLKFAKYPPQKVPVRVSIPFLFNKWENSKRLDALSKATTCEDRFPNCSSKASFFSLLIIHFHR